MKKWMPLATAALFALSIQTPSYLRADDSEHKGKGFHHMDEKSRLEHMTKELNLTPDQQTKVKAAMDAKRDKMKPARDSFQESMKTSNEEFESSVLAILNDDQKKKFNDMKAKREAKMKEWKEKHKDQDGDDK